MIGAVNIYSGNANSSWSHCGYNGEHNEININSPIYKRKREDDDDEDLYDIPKKSAKKKTKVKGETSQKELDDLAWHLPYPRTPSPSASPSPSPRPSSARSSPHAHVKREYDSNNEVFL